LRRILIAWELGGNWGHLARELPVALALRERGYDVRFAVRDPGLADRLLRPHGLPYFQAPLPPRRPGPRATPESYADILRAEGYGERNGIAAAMSAWLERIREIEPAAIVADFAPGAMLAARAAGRPLIVLGLGFEVPLATEPLPSIRPERPTPLERRLASERELLRVLNDALAQVSAAPLAALHELFPPSGIALTTFPELDHHRGERRGGRFVGPIHSTPPDAVSVSWPRGRGPRLLAYLSPATRGLAAVLAALRSRGTLVACVPDGASPAGPSGTIPGCHSRALRLELLLPEADLLVTNGGLATSTRALLHGVPVLAVPNVVEQYLGAVRVADLGAGVIADRGRTQRQLETRVEDLLRPAYRDCARRFASRYAGETVEKAVQRVISLIEAAVRRIGAQTPSPDPP
jgi:UDP:flavonoid glycosyltransferase YjiC (YdhE family)